MSKQIIIEKCEDCPYSTARFVCAKEHKVFPLKQNKIPAWCPLQDYKGDK